MNTRTNRILACASLLLAFAASTPSAQAAYPDISATQSLLSAFHDTSNFWQSTTTYGFNLYNGPSDPALYINQINFLPGAQYDANIGLAPPTGTTYQTGFGAYTLGTPLAPDTLMYLYDAVSRSGNVLPAIQKGVYDFNLQILGGYDSAAMDILANIPYQILIADGIRVSATALASPGAISAGQTSTVSMTVTNNDPTQTFLTTTWFVSDFSNGTDSLPFTGFAGDWFDKSILPGGSLTDLHSTWNATDTTPLGTYTGLVGVVGGLVNGDNMYILADPGPTVDVVVPEPASLGVVILGLASLMPRRHRRA